jgi:hypothetical protein
MDANTLVKGKLPDWLMDMFKKVDAKDIPGASAYFAANADFYFGHYHVTGGVNAILKFMGTFDGQFSEYHHLIDEAWVGPTLVEFGGRVQFKVDDGTVRESPFWNRFFYDSSSGSPKLVKAYAITDLAMLPAKYTVKLDALTPAAAA